MCIRDRSYDFLNKRSREKLSLIRGIRIGIGQIYVGSKKRYAKNVWGRIVHDFLGQRDCA